MHFLVVKHGALGDVVRTSYFAAPLRRKTDQMIRVSWITAPSSVPLIAHHPAIDDVWTNFGEARNHFFDCIYSLDDETEILRGVAQLRTARLVGAYIGADGVRRYTDDAAEWFDMGLLSRFGKARADELKRRNERSHGEIFAHMFGVDRPEPSFHGAPAMDAWAREWLGPLRPVVGINPFAGGRWPSKELPLRELRELVRGLLDDRSRYRRCHIVLIGAGEDRTRNLTLAAEVRSERLSVADTDDSLLRLAAVVGSLDHLVTSDSLAMHLAIAQGVTVLAFFAPTSAAEIDRFGIVEKIASTAPDYCSYRADTDNSSITAARLLERLQ